MSYVYSTCDQEKMEEELKADICDEMRPLTSGKKVYSIAGLLIFGIYCKSNLLHERMCW